MTMWCICWPAIACDEVFRPCVITYVFAISLDLDLDLDFNPYFINTFKNVIVTWTQYYAHVVAIFLDQLLRIYNVLLLLVR